MVPYRHLSLMEMIIKTLTWTLEFELHFRSFLDYYYCYVCSNIYFFHERETSGNNNNNALKQDDKNCDKFPWLVLRIEETDFVNRARGNRHRTF